MARPLRIEVPGGFHHVISRGNARQPVFLDDGDRHAFLLLLRQTARRTGWKCLSYCLMGNHYHLLLQTPRPNLALGMRDLNGIYAQDFNRRHGRIGHLWQSRYHAQLVQDNAYIWAVARYIALNPVRQGLVVDPGDWPWSSHASVVAGASNEVLDQPALLAHFHWEPVRARTLYRALVEGGAEPVDDFDPLRPIAGDEEFVRSHAPRERPAAEVLKTAWEQARPPLQDLQASLDRDTFFLTAREIHRYTLREVAGAAGVSIETVRRRIHAAKVVRDVECEDLTP